MNRRGRVTATAAAILATLAAATGGASAQGVDTADPEAGARAAMKGLVKEARGLKRSDADRRTRRSLVRLATRAGRSALRRPCASSKLVEELRPRVRKVSDEVKPAKGSRAKAPGPPSPQGALTTAAFAASAALLQLPNSGSCGGGAAPAGSDFAVRPASSDAQGTTLSVFLPRARWTPRSGGGKDFTEIDMGGIESVGKVGEPGVPAFTKLLALPRGAGVDVTVANVEGYTLQGVRPFPKQEEAVDTSVPGVPDKVFADPPFAFNEKSYQGRTPIPSRLGVGARAGTLRDLQLGAVQIAGAQFKPSERKLDVLTRIDVRVEFTGASSGEFTLKRRRSPFERVFPRAYRAAVANADAVAAEDEVSDQDAQETVPPCGEDMLIVTPPALRPAADSLAEARRATGMVVAVVETGSEEGQIGTLNTEIRDFIRGALNDDNCTRPTYVVLVGDAAQLPTFMEPDCRGGCGPGSNPPLVASDLQYSLDGIGEDPFADVLLGRLPAADLAKAQTMVAKIVGYETAPPAPPGDDFYNEATVTAAFEGAGPRDSRTFTRAAETVRAGLRSRGHSVERLYSASPTADIQEFKDGAPMPTEIKRPAEPWTAGRDQVVDAFNDGRFFFMHRDHGSHFGWASPALSAFDMPRLTNGTQLPVVFGVNCASGGFQIPSESIAQAMLNDPDGGAVGYFGDTTNSPTNENTRLAIGWADALFPQTVPAAGPPEPLTRMGEVLNAGKVAMGEGAPLASQLSGNVFFEHLIWHYLGDPSMEMWAAVPSEFQNVETLYEPRTGAFPFDAPAFGVRVTVDQPGTDGAIATLRNDGEAIGRAIVEDGQAVISPDRRTDSSGLTVALERDGFVPREVPVTAPAPTHTIQCPPTIDIEFGVLARGQVLNNGTPLKDGLVTLRFTTPSRTFTRSVLTDNEGRWFRQEPVGGDHGTWRIEAFFHDKGVKDAVCEFVVP